MRQTPATFPPRRLLLQGALTVALALGAGVAQAGAADLPGEDSPDVAPCRAGQADACAALIRQIRAPAGTPPSPAQRCVTALQTQVLDQLDCRRGRASGCTAAAAYVADAACPAALDAAVRAQADWAEGGALPTEPAL
ncbi:hypothetical protein, partial [Stenotrophomonas sp.]|uniref:hypothetical protein n=1 Tax=Stenotrophomonas sp. TaxID=69392 RepID=UPI002FC80B7C